MASDETRSQVLVAASGGADSTATLIAVARAIGPERVVAAHFDHRLRPAADAEADRDAVTEVAARLGVALALGRAGRRPAGGSEAAAREARYRWLARIARERGITACITGHTRDDQAETVLLRLTRGSGALGAAGMRPEAPWPVRAPGGRSLRLLRPLLETSRAEVEAYLAALGVTASEDASNASLDYARNRVRHEVLPALRAVNERAVDHLVEFASAQRADDEALTGIASEWIERHARRVPGGIDLDRAGLRALPDALGSRVLRQAAGVIGVTVQGAHLRAVLGSLEKSGARVDLPLARSRVSGSLLELRIQPSPTAGRD